jgi:hypothetical protein
MRMSWEEWEGEGFDTEEVIAFSFGRWDRDMDEITKHLRRLDIGVRGPESYELMPGWVGRIGGDIVYHACGPEGRVLNDTDIVVDDGSVMKVTFVRLLDMS